MTKWKAHKHPDAFMCGDGSYAILEAGKRFYRGGQAYVAILPRWEGHKNESHFYAHLVAAAPELLEALKKAVQFMNEVYGCEVYPSESLKNKIKSFEDLIYKVESQK